MSAAMILLDRPAWLAIEDAPRDGSPVELWAEGAMVFAWTWDAANQRWSSEDGLHWAEGDYGPTHFRTLLAVQLCASLMNTEVPTSPPARPTRASKPDHHPQPRTSRC